MTSQQRPARWTEPTGEPRASRISKITQEIIPYRAGSGRGSHISCRKSRQHSTLVSLVGIAFWTPDSAPFPALPSLLPSPLCIPQLPDTDPSLVHTIPAWTHLILTLSNSSGVSLQPRSERHAGGGVISPPLSQHDQPPSLHPPSPRLPGFC